MNRKPNLATGILAGIAGGLVASWTMNQFQSGLSKVEEAWQKSAHQPKPPKPPSEEDDATMKTADRLAQTFAHRSLTKEEKKKAGPVVHYVYGAIIGGCYGALTELSPSFSAGIGTGYATAIWLLGDEVAVPALGLSKSPTEYPVGVHAKSLASHLVYGVTTDAVRRAIRAAA